MHVDITQQSTQMGEGAAQKPVTVPHVVIIGAGFGGLEAAKALGKQPVKVTVIDRTNHHLFQPMLYQVATAGLSPADISTPIRHVLRKHKNTEVLMGEVTGIDVQARCVRQYWPVALYWLCRLVRLVVRPSLVSDRAA